MENNFRETISNEELAEMQTLQFGGKIVVVDREELVEQACADLMSCTVIGFDTETRPKFTKGTPNKVALLQLSTPKTCYLFRLCMMPFDKAIIKVLENKEIAKIGADVTNDIRALKKVRQFTHANFIDLQNIAQEWGIAEKSVRKLSAIVLAGKVSKAQRLSNWEAQVLTHPQQLYAATDAWVCTEIYEQLLATNKR